MIDAGIIASSFVNQKEVAAEATLRSARASLRPQQTAESREKAAEQAAADFESLFISQMLSHMFGNSLGEDFFGSSESSDAYRALMVEEYGKQITANGGIGIADYVKRELLKLQEIES